MLWHAPNATKSTSVQPNAALVTDSEKTFVMPPWTAVTHPSPTTSMRPTMSLPTLESRLPTRASWPSLLPIFPLPYVVPCSPFSWFLFLSVFFLILCINLAFQLSRESVCATLCVLTSQLAFSQCVRARVYIPVLFLSSTFADTFSWTLLWWRTLVRNVSYYLYNKTSQKGTSLVLPLFSYLTTMRCNVEFPLLFILVWYSGHQRLLRLEYYGIRDKTHGWIRIWLTTRK